jgi:uncharacterized protein YqhQ
MKYSGVGGQAVMEGIMMRNQDRYAVAVRKPDKEISVEVFDYKGPTKNNKLREIPVLRGVLNFVDSLYLGMTTLMYSSSFFEEEEEKEQEKETQEETIEEEILETKIKETKEKKKEDKKKETAMMGGTVALSIILAIGIFFVVPYFISSFFQRFIETQWIIVLLEGMIRLAIFIGYVSLVSLVPDIKRTYMYHGAEHKCINCIEHGLELTLENVRKSSKQHKRCGTSFLLIVMLISVVFFMFIRVDSAILKLLLRLLLIPVIAGVSYEFIRLAGKYDNWFINLLSVPGLWMQNITTKEPDDDMIEVGIASVEAVFDWKKWQEEELK